MASKDISNRPPSRVPETRVVGPSRFRIRQGQDPLIQGADRFISPYSKSNTRNGEEDESGGEFIPETKDPKVEEIEDVVNLSDIEDIDFIEYKNKEGVTKIKVLIKIRNSSKNKENVKGVDGRIPLA